MVRDNMPSIECSICRRDVLKGVGAASIAGAAGCIGEDGEAEINDPDDDPDNYPEWDPETPEWPQKLSTILEDDFHRPSREFLEDIEPRDEPVYGDPPNEMPAPEDEWIDPDPIVFARGPTEADPEEYRDTYGPLMDAIEEETGREVEFFEMDDFSAGVEAMRAERLHVSAFDTGTTPFAVNLAGAGERMYLTIDDGGLVGYRLWLLTYVGSGIDRVQDLAGHTVAHGSETSNSGNLAPRALFANEYDTIPDEDYEVEFAGGHEQVLRGIHAGDYIAGPVCSSCIERVYDGDEDLNPDDGPGGQEMKVVFSQEYPSGVHIIRYNLHPDILDGIERAYFDYDWEVEAPDWNAADVVEVDYNSYYHPALLVHQDQEIEYGEDLD